MKSKGDISPTLQTFISRPSKFMVSKLKETDGLDNT